MNRNLMMGLLAASLMVKVEQIRADVDQGQKPKGKMEVPPKPTPKPQSQSLQRMLRKAK